MSLESGSPSSDSAVFFELYRAERLLRPDVDYVAHLFEKILTAAKHVIEGDEELGRFLPGCIGDFRRLLGARADSMLRQVGIDPDTAQVLEPTQWQNRIPGAGLPVLSGIQKVRERLRILGEMNYNEGAALN